jgi:hypothetical protein
MRALVVDSLATGPMVREVPVPAPAPGQVRVRIRAAALHPVDGRIGDGLLDEPVSYDFPVVLGRDAAGVVDRIGAGVTGLAAGDEVLAHIPLGRILRHGTVADYAVFPSATVALKPSRLSFAHAAAIPLRASAALAATDAVAPRPGDTVLIVGGGHGVAAYAAQFVRARGATVRFAADPGALAQRDEFEQVDALIDLREFGGSSLADLLFGGRGRAVTLRPVSPAGELAVRAVSPTPSAAIVASLARDVAAGVLRTQPTELISLDDAETAVTDFARRDGSVTPVVMLG